MRTPSKKILRALAALLCFVTLLAAVPTTVGADSTTDSISAQEAKLKSLSEKADEYNKKLKESKAQQRDLAESLSEYNELIATYQDVVSTADALVAEYDAAILQKNAEIEENEAAYEKKYEYFLGRLRATREEGEISYLQLIFSAGSFLEMLQSLERSGDLLTYDARIMKELDEQTEKLKSDKSSLEELRAGEKQTQEIYSQKTEALSATIDELESQMEKIKENIRENEAAAKYYADAEEKAEKELDAAIAAYNAKKAADEAARKKAEEDAKKKNEESKYDGPKYVTDDSTPCWPLPSSWGKSKISSPFGYRYHPITGVWKLHTGTDIYAPYGTPIYAVLGGTVVSAGYSSSYGNNVIIDHGNGVTTLYAHCSKLLVSSGQTVKKGQQIGKVGMTGSATGYHLHIEWRKNGERKNPMNYIPGP